MDNKMIIGKRLQRKAAQLSSIFTAISIALLIFVVDKHVTAQSPVNLVRTLAWNPNSTILAVGEVSESQPRIAFYNVDGQLIDLINISSRPLSIAWSPDSAKLAVRVSGEPDTFQIFDANTKTVLMTFDQAGASEDNFAYWSPNGNRIATVAGRDVILRNASNGQIIVTLFNPGGSRAETIRSVAWSSDGSKLFTASSESIILVWDVNTFQITNTFQQSYNISSMAISPDGNRLAIGSSDRIVRILDSITGSLITSYQGTTSVGTKGVIWFLSWHPSGNQIASATFETITIWDLFSSQVVEVIPQIDNSFPEAMDYSSNGKFAYSNSPGQIIVVDSPQVFSDRGLFGQFFDNSDLTGFKLNRVDPTVNFTWGSGSPDPSIDVNTFSTRWTGQIIPQFSETYTFYTQSDDGVRLWVNDTLLINNWTDHSSTEDSATIALTANFRYNIKLEYYDNTYSSTIRLSWSSPSQPKQVVPQDRLFPNGKIVFQSNTTGNNEIFIMNADGTGVQNRTNNSASDTYPSVVPGGTQIVFVSSRDGNGEIYSMPLNGGTATNLTNHSATDNYPSLYQDGRIVFSSARNGGNFNLWLRDAAGTVTQLTNTTGTERHSAWSPNGQWIVYDMEEGGVTHLYKIPASGGTPVQLTTVASNFEPDWSLDGTKITFRSNRSGSSQVYVMNANGSNQAPFIATPPSGFNPTWGMDSGRVTFHSWKDSSQPEIYTLAAGASAAVRLTNNSILDQYPVWGAQ